MSIPQGPIHMTILSSPLHLPVVRAALEQFCQLAGFAESCTGYIVLSVDEALTNVIKHAYDGREGQPIEITFNLLNAQDDDPALEVVLQDYGRRVDISCIRGRNLADVRPGGLGVHIMNRCMDRVEFVHPPEGGTRLRMLKKRSSGGPALPPASAEAGQHGQ